MGYSSNSRRSSIPSGCDGLCVKVLEGLQRWLAQG
jgi:hypothetical protein